MAGTSKPTVQTGLINRDASSASSATHNPQQEIEAEPSSSTPRQDKYRPVTSSRVESLDLLRGLIMVIMLFDRTFQPDYYCVLLKGHS